MTPRRAPPPRPRPKGRRGVPSGVRAVPPVGAARTYARALAAWDRAVSERITEEFRAAGLLPARANAGADGGPSEIVRALDVAVASKRLRSLLRALLLGLQHPLEVLDVVSSRVAAHTEREWSRQLAALGVKLDDVAHPNINILRALWRQHNADLIKSLTVAKVDRMRRVLEESPGSRVEDLADQIEAETGASRSRAELLARDQTLKLAGQVTQARHQAAGVVEYIWRTSLDERVRASHKALDGTRQRYSLPPVVDAKRGRRCAPGADFQCRCTADPILPGLDALNATAATPRAA